MNSGLQRFKTQQKSSFIHFTKDKKEVNHDENISKI